MRPRAVRTGGERAFRVLMRLYPRSFRDQFGDDMIEFFRARRDEQRHRHGVRGLTRLWAHLVVDIAVNAPLQHARAITALRAIAMRPTSAGDVPWAAAEYPVETHPMETLGQDIRYALRLLARQPGFTIVAGLTLAIGIGATTAIFSVVDAVLLRPLPWPAADRLVIVGTGQGGVSYLDYRDWREQSASFEELGVMRGQSVNLTGGEVPDRLTGEFVTASTFRMLGASVVRGRLFNDRETEVATKQPVAVISEAAWRVRFASSPDLPGRIVTFNGQAFTVVGIMRPGFTEPFLETDVWLPIGYYPNKGELENRGRGGVMVVGRLKPQVALAGALSDLSAIADRLGKLYPGTNAGVRMTVQPFRDQIVGPSRTPVLTVLAAVATVLLIACANVANLQLARATTRRRELSVRAALGASRRRLLRQLITESIVLSAIGGVAGLILAYGGVQWLSAMVPNVLSFFGDISLNQHVLGFALLVTVATSLVFGIAPAWQASRAQVQEALAVRDATANSSMRLRMRTALVAGQISLCVVLLVSAGLLTRSLMAIVRVNPGFDPEHVLTLQFRLPPTKYDSEDKIADMFTRTIASIRAVPGVQRAALVRATPLNGNGERFPYQIDGQPSVDRATLPTAHRNIVSPGYFETLSIPLQGRDFTLDDRRGGMPVAIVNEQLAKRMAPAGSALGLRIRLLEGDQPAWATVVGVAGNARHFQLQESPIDQVYVPYTQRPLIFTEAVVRAAGDPMLIANDVRHAIWRVDRDQPVWRVRPLTLSIDGALGARRLMMGLLASFAGAAVVLALIGVYGVMSYSVAQRRQEMGIRMALGARASQVRGLVLRQGLRTILIALASGLALSLLATRALEAELFGVQRFDPLTFGVVTVILAVAASAACYLPARRASRVDPVVALRAE